jgi:hypothetical protein
MNTTSSSSVGAQLSILFLAWNKGVNEEVICYFSVEFNLKFGIMSLLTIFSPLLRGV